MPKCAHEKGFIRPPPPLFDVRSIEGKPPLKLPGPVCKVCKAEVTTETANAAEERVRLIARLTTMHEEATELEKKLEAVEELLDKAPAVASATVAPPSASVEDQAKRLAAPPDEDDAPLPTPEELAKMSPDERRKVGAHMNPETRKQLTELLGAP